LTGFLRAAEASGSTSILAGFLLVAASLAQAHLSAQGLGGPSSVQADLEPGDGLNAPQFRSDFPRNITPGYFTWKDRLAKDHGFRFNFDYLALGQSSNADLGEPRHNVFDA
jgi:porin